MYNDIFIAYTVVIVRVLSIINLKPIRCRGSGEPCRTPGWLAGLLACGTPRGRGVSSAETRWSLERRDDSVKHR